MANNGENYSKSNMWGLKSLCIQGNIYDERHKILDEFIPPFQVYDGIIYKIIMFQ